MPAKKRGIAFRAFDKFALVVAVVAIGWGGWKALGRFGDIEEARGYTATAVKRAGEINRRLTEEEPVVKVPEEVLASDADPWSPIVVTPIIVTNATAFRRPATVFYAERRVGVNRDNVVLTFANPLREGTVAVDVFAVEGADNDIIRDIVHPYQGDNHSISFRTITYGEFGDPVRVIFVGYDGNWAQHRYPMVVDREVDKTPWPPTEARIARVENAGLTLVFTEDPRVALPEGIAVGEEAIGEAGLKNVRYVIERRDWRDPLGAWARVCRLDQNGQITWTRPGGLSGTSGRGDPTSVLEEAPEPDPDDDDDDDEAPEPDPGAAIAKANILWWRDVTATSSQRGDEHGPRGETDVLPALALQRGAAYSYRVRVAASNTFPEVSGAFSSTDIARMPVELDAMIVKMRAGPGVPVRATVTVARHQRGQIQHSDFPVSVGDTLGTVVERDDVLAELATGWTVLACHLRVRRKIDGRFTSDNRLICGDAMGRLFVIWGKSSLNGLVPMIPAGDGPP